MLFSGPGYKRIRFATSLDNKAMRHIVENKYGLKPTIHEDEDEEYSFAEYYLEESKWQID